MYSFHGSTGGHDEFWFSPEADVSTERVFVFEHDHLIGGFSPIILVPTNPARGFARGLLFPG